MQADIGLDLGFENDVVERVPYTLDFFRWLSGTGPQYVAQSTLSLFLSVSSLTADSSSLCAVWVQVQFELTRKTMV